jgi:hypothetical protein
VALLAAPGTGAAATVANGDFETGTLAGWTQNVDPSGAWFAYSGTTTPAYGLPIAAPPQGSFAAVADMSSPGTRILYQDVALEPGTHTLSLYAYYRSTEAIAHPTPDSLSSSGGSNQQYRIDVVKPSAPLDSIDPADILVPVFRTATGDPQTLAPTIKTADLSPFAGQTVRLRFAEADNQGPLNASTDAVSIASTPPSTSGTPPGTANPTGAPGKDPKCKNLRKKLKHQQKGLAEATTEAKQARIQANIEDTKKRLEKLGCK